ncbi:oxidoreductase C-terminal domain-containing protein [Streptomyces sp. NPDC127197]|uniref:oxidoreductase C-terminal domain-containing protein n=1 Tax=Streptomyces sp. NPDC127197 TaxID=3345388 RepID=UPI00362B0D0E
MPYFWSDQYDMRVQAYGFLRGHDEVAVGMPPRAIRVWRQAIAAGAGWQESVPAAKGAGQIT